jgi:hypothetical protein
MKVTPPPLSKRNSELVKSVDAVTIFLGNNIKVVMGFVHIARDRLTLVARHVTAGGMRKIRSDEFFHPPPHLTLSLYSQYKYIFYPVSKHDVSHKKKKNYRPLIYVLAFFASNF